MDSRIGPKHNYQGTEVRAECRECNRETTHTISASAEFESEYSERDFSISSWDDYQVIECKGCQTVSFRHRSRNTEDTDHDPNTGEELLVEAVRLYPELSGGRAAMPKAELLTSSIQQIYEETLSALNGDMRVLAGIGIRALVETMCKDRNAKGGNLETRIDDLVSQGTLAREGAEILHGLRIMGNQAAHEVRPHTAEDLNVALDVIEHALLGIYVLPAQTGQLPRRHNKGKATDSAEAATQG